MSIMILRESATINNQMTRLLAVLTEFLFVASTSLMTEFLAIIALY